MMLCFLLSFFLPIHSSQLEGRISVPTFLDVTADSGIQFKHVDGRSGQKYLLETLGSGIACFPSTFRRFHPPRAVALGFWFWRVQVRD